MSLHEASPCHTLKRLDAASYDVVAEAFDGLTERFAAPLAARMLELAALAPTDRVLDIGTGTGLVALRAARLVAHGEVVGIDHSPGMLRHASVKAQQSGLERTVTFLQMDAEELDFANASFDRVVSLFVLLHLPDIAAAVREMHRILRPAGRIVIGVGRGPRLFSRVGLGHAARRLAVRLEMAHGRVLLAPGFLAGLMADHGLWPRPARAAPSRVVDIATLLRRAGFGTVHASWQGSWAELDAESFWAVETTYGSPERIRLAQLKSTQVEGLKAEFLQRCHEVRAKGGRLLYPYGAMFYHACRS